MDLNPRIIKMLFASAKSYIRYLFTLHYYFLLPKIDKEISER